MLLWWQWWSLLMLTNKYIVFLSFCFLLQPNLYRWMTILKLLSSWVFYVMNYSPMLSRWLLLQPNLYVWMTILSCSLLRCFYEIDYLLFFSWAWAIFFLSWMPIVVGCIHLILVSSIDSSSMACWLFCVSISLWVPSLCCGWFTWLIFVVLFVVLLLVLLLYLLF